MRPISELFQLLETPQRCFVICHHKPDGDAIGSILGLTHYLKLKGHQVTTVAPSEVPHFLEWMPGAGQIIDLEKDEVLAQEALDQATLIFGLDFNDFSRTKHFEQQLLASKAGKVIIDHHMFPKDYWDFGLSDPAKSSTCEMVYDFINLAGDNILINIPIAECLYTGILTDTGSFRFPVTTAAVHRAVAVFLERGLNHTAIHEHIHDSWSEDRMRFIGYMLVERMEIFPKYKAGLIAVTKKDLKTFGLGSGDTEGLVNYPLSIEGIQFAVLITERTDEVKLSFRSKGDFDVNRIAREHFNGGGHFNASGGSFKRGFNETIEYFKEILPQIAPRRAGE